MGSKRPEKDRAEEAFTVIESALGAARSNPAIAEGNVDLLGAELLYGVLLCRFRNSDDGIRRCRDVAAIASKHHGDESLTVELAFGHLAECLWRHGDRGGGASMAVSAYRMATSRDEPSPWRLADMAVHRGGNGVRPRARRRMCRIHGQSLGARRGDAFGGGQVADDWDPAAGSGTRFDPARHD